MTKVEDRSRMGISLDSISSKIQISEIYTPENLANGSYKLEMLLPIKKK